MYPRLGNVDDRLLHVSESTIRQLSYGRDAYRIPAKGTPAIGMIGLFPCRHGLLPFIFLNADLSMRFAINCFLILNLRKSQS